MSQEADCDICSKHFQSTYALKRHKRNVHKLDIPITTIPKYQICPVCAQNVGITLKELHKHISDTHQIKIEEITLAFRSEDDFLKWKANEEKETKSLFVKRSTNRMTKSFVSTSTYYYCHRSGFYRSKSNRKRQIKTQGTNKINSSCPAQMKVKKFKRGSIQLVYVRTHVGHSQDVRRMLLTDDEKKFIADKISRNVPFNRILNDAKNNNGDISRMQLLTRRDLLNIAAEYNLKHKVTSNDVMAHLDTVMTEAIAVVDSPVVFYKPKGEVNDFLGEDDFLLIIMNKLMKDVCNDYGNNVVCIDSTILPTNFNYFLTSILVVDDVTRAFPVAFIFSNNQEEKTIQLAFEKLKSTGVNVLVNNLITDLDEKFTKAWARVFEVPLRHKWTSWHVDDDWQKRLKNIKNENLQHTTYIMLTGVMQQSELVDFDRMLNEAVNNLFTNAETKEFAMYFITRYLKNCEKWAFCHRNFLGENTNSNLDKLHKLIVNKQFKQIGRTVSCILTCLSKNQFGLKKPKRREVNMAAETTQVLADAQREFHVTSDETGREVQICVSQVFKKPFEDLVKGIDEFVSSGNDEGFALSVLMEAVEKLRANKSGVEEMETGGGQEVVLAENNELMLTNVFNVLDGDKIVFENVLGKEIVVENVEVCLGENMECTQIENVIN